ncbi:MBL fold metallo-hydrolase [Telmatospirillum siberiense]|nr:MBL fold metallo-hydrolase [Telmatospirillum siberiense]
MLDAKSGVEYVLTDYPKPGQTIEIAQGIHWLSTPLPFRLRAVNLYLLEDDAGWVIVDFGYSNDEVKAQWEQVWASTLKGKPVTRLIATHFHPDHIGNAGWLSGRWNLPVMASRAEWLTANRLLGGPGVEDKERSRRFYLANGLSEDVVRGMEQGYVPYSRGVSLAGAYEGLSDGDRLRIGGDGWRAIAGGGHSPEHLSLYCEERGILIAGDQLLPEITPNVSVWPDEPEADALGLFLRSLDRFRAELRPDTLVLPSHRRPFRGALARIDEIRDHHRDRLDVILEKAAEGPVTAGGILPFLFPQHLDALQTMFALGEALAHLNRLAAMGRLRREAGDDGIVRFHAGVSSRGH